MKRFSSGRGSNLQPGVLKPRNGDFTSNNRQSTGQSARRSYIQKLGLTDSAKRVYSRGMRGSTENVMRSTLVSSRFTPKRVNKSPWNPQSIDRMSMDSARNSGIGMSTRKDTRPITDPAYKTQCINKILEFLRNGYPHPFQRRTLLTPSTNDFTNIFSFVYKHLDPSFVLPTRFEEEIPKLLRKLNYPGQMTKSSFVSVGSPHTWPAVLAMLVFLIDMANFCSILSQDFASPSDLDADDGSSRRQSLFISLYKCAGEDEVTAGLQEYCKDLKSDENVSEKDMEELQEEVEASEHTLDSLPSTVEELKQLQQCYAQCSDDLIKLTSYCQDLQVAIESKATKQNAVEQKLAELSERECLICEEVEHLKKLQAQQSLSSSDLIHFKNHSQEVGREIEQQESTGKDLQNQIWNAELEIPKLQPSLRSSFALSEGLLEKLELNDFSDMMTNYEDFNHHFDTIISRIMECKKIAKKSASLAQKKIWELDQEISKVKGILQEKQTESKKLEIKLRHSEEEFSAAQEEIRQEEQVRLEETEFLHKQIMEARKTHKKSLYQLQRLKGEKERELEGYKKEEITCLRDGTQFLTKICQETNQSVEHKESIIAEYRNHINAECEQFLQWLDIAVKED